MVFDCTRFEESDAIRICRREEQSRRKDCTMMEQKMPAKMEQGLRNEQQARQQAQNEIMKGLDEESATQMVHKDVAVMKQENKKCQVGVPYAVRQAPLLVWVHADDLLRRQLD